MLTITDVNEAPVFSSANGFSNALATVAAGEYSFSPTRKHLQLRVVPRLHFECD